MSDWNMKRWCWRLRIFSNIFISISMLFSLEFRSTCNWKRFSLRRESIIVKSSKNGMKVVESFSNCQNQRKKGLSLLCSIIATMSSWCGPISEKYCKTIWKRGKWKLKRGWLWGRRKNRASGNHLEAVCMHTRVHARLPNSVYRCALDFAQLRACALISIFFVHVNACLVLVVLFSRARSWLAGAIM